jgi:hypothetical protein
LRCGLSLSPNQAKKSVGRLAEGQPGRAEWLVRE